VRSSVIGGPIRPMPRQSAATGAGAAVVAGSARARSKSVIFRLKLAYEPLFRGAI
jgi:hypothetical protein